MEDNAKITKIKEESIGFSDYDLSERHKILPESIRRALVDWQIGQTVKKILAGQAIGREKLADVLHLVGLVLVGMYSREDFVKYLAEDLEADALAGQTAAKEIDAKVFLPLKDEIENLYDLPLASENGGTKEEEKVLNLNWNDQGREGISSPKAMLEPKPQIAKSVGGAAVPEAKPIPPKIFPRQIESDKKDEAVAPIGRAPILILGREEEIKPTLESKPSLTNVFDEVKPKEKPILVNLETKKIEAAAPLKSAGFFGKFKEKILGGENANKQPADPQPPVKKIDYSADAKPIKAVDAGGSGSASVAALEDKEIVEKENETKKNDSVVDLKKMKF